jgi:hypothetical protein
MNRLIITAEVHYERNPDTSGRGERWLLVSCWAKTRDTELSAGMPASWPARVFRHPDRPLCTVYRSVHGAAVGRQGGLVAVVFCYAVLDDNEVGDVRSLGWSHREGPLVVQGAVGFRHRHPV